MNLILLGGSDFDGEGRVVLVGRRARHVHEVLGVVAGARVLVGRLEGRCGSALVVESTADRLILAPPTLEHEPPAPSEIVLALALPRPPTLRKVLQQATALGVKRVVLFHAARVEKSYWKSSALQSAAIEAQLRLGLEQARDTRLPVVETIPRFLPFAEDRLPDLARTGPVWLADLDAARPAPADVRGVQTLVVGPEGGLLPFEVERIVTSGATPVALGDRALRVETAVVALLGRLSPEARRG